MKPATLFRVNAGVFVGLLLSTFGGCTRDTSPPQSKPFVAPKSQQEADIRLYGAIHSFDSYSNRYAENFNEFKNLLEAGANPNFELRDANLSIGGAPIYPLNEAARAGRLELVELLVAKGAKVNAESWEPALGSALTGRGPTEDQRNRAYAVATFLVEKRADVNRRIWNLQPLDSTFPLHVGVKEKRIEFVQLVLKHGAEVNARNGSGRTPLDVAVEDAKSTELADMLKAKGGLRGSELPKEDKKP